MQFQGMIAEYERSQVSNLAVVSCMRERCSPRAAFVGRGCGSSGSRLSRWRHTKASASCIASTAASASFPDIELLCLSLAVWATCLFRHVRSASFEVVAVSTSRVISFLRFGSWPNHSGSTEMLIVLFPATVRLSVNRQAARTIASTSRFRYRFSNAWGHGPHLNHGGIVAPEPVLEVVEAHPHMEVFGPQPCEDFAVVIAEDRSDLLDHGLVELHSGEYLARCRSLSSLRFSERFQSMVPSGTPVFQRSDVASPQSSPSLRRWPARCLRRGTP